MNAGHVLIDPCGKLIGVDTAFCAIMDSDAARLIGQSVNDLTALGDRCECAAAISNLRATGRPFTIVKRFARDDGTLVWVKNSVSITSNDGAPGTIMATIEPVEERTFAESPADFVETARFLAAANDARSEVCELSLLPEPSWSFILAAYVAEAEGRAFDAQALISDHGLSPILADRLLKALVASGTLEIEYRRPVADAPKSYRLTLAAQGRLERYLSDFRLNARDLGLSGSPSLPHLQG